MRQEFSRQLGCELTKTTFCAEGASFEVDGSNSERRILVEFYAHIGVLKPAQVKKVLTDFLKLILLDSVSAEPWEKYVVFACEQSASKFKSGSGWPALAARRYGIGIEVIDIGSSIREKILRAQRRQNHLNADRKLAQRS